MKIIHFEKKPLAELPFLNAGKKPGQVKVDKLPVFEAKVDHLPNGITAIVATSDLQGRALQFNDLEAEPPLLGEIVPFWLREEVLPFFDCIDLSRIAALLAGDFFTVSNADKRGGTGDVSKVWKAFGDCFSWVAGVAGNHDLFGADQLAWIKSQKNLYLLDGDLQEIAGIRFGGLGGIIGNSSKPQRREEVVYLNTLAKILSRNLDILIMHEGPDGNGPEQPGNRKICEAMNRSWPDLVIRGHQHWDQPFAQLPCGTQVLNVDMRVVILTI